MSKKTTLTYWGETQKNFFEHKSAVAGSLSLGVIRAAALPGAVYCFYYAIKLSSSLGSNATSEEKMGAFSGSSWLGFAFFVFASMALTIPQVQNTLLDPVATSLSEKLVTKLMGAYYDLPYEKFIKTSPSLPVHLFGFAFEHIGPAFTNTLIEKIFGSSMELFSLILSVSIEFPVVGAILFSGVAVIASASYCFSKQTVSASHFNYVHELDGGYYGIITQKDKYKQVLYFDRKDTEIANTRNIVSDLSHVSNDAKRMIHMAKIASHWGYFIFGCAALVRIFYATIFDLPDDDKIRSFIPMFMLGQVANSLQILSASIVEYVKNIRPYSDLIDFVNKSQELSKNTLPRLSLPSSSPASVEFKEVSFSYPETGFYLENVSFIIEPGSAVALVGTTGSGKTTILNMLLRLLNPKNGTILIGGEDIAKSEPKSVRRVFGIVPQEATLGEKTISKNIQYGLPESETQEADDQDLKERTEEAARSASLGAIVDANQLHRDVGYMGAALSGGEAQRVSIARALIRSSQEKDKRESTKARIFVFDEPTSKVDPETRNFIWSSIHLLIQRGHTVIIITHDLKRVQETIALEQIINVSLFKVTKPTIDDQAPSNIDEVVVT